MNLNEFDSLFPVDSARDLLIPDRRFCRLNLGPAVASAKKALLAAGDDEFDAGDFVELPSWPKAYAFPSKASAFFNTIFRAMSTGVNRLESVLVDYQLEAAGLMPRHRYTCSTTGNRVLVEMIFTSCRTKKALKQVCEIYRTAVPNTVVIPLCGDEFNGKDLTNETAQGVILDAIKSAAKNNQNVMIISMGMGQRSFSIPSLSTVYLCYDGGEEGATRQKTSRSLTSDTEDKIGYIISCSFDPNRDDKLSPELLETMNNLKPKYPTMSARDLLKYVLRTENLFFDFTDQGAELVTPDSWIDNADKTGVLRRVLGASSNIYALSPETRSKWAKAQGYVAKKGDDEVEDTGDTYSKDKPKRKTNKQVPSAEDIERDELTAARAAITLLFDKFHILQAGTGCRTVEDILEAIKNDSDHNKFFEQCFKLEIDTVLDSIREGAINTTALEMALN